jgi:lipopolysaccharide/colanic/teichoic acid biosynthesis glycosyltransferase
MSASFYARYGKSCLDATAALVGLTLLSPFLILATILVLLDSPGPAFFLQVRAGQFGKPFRIIKFRTMRAVKAQNGPLITASGDSRVTRLGRWLRKTKIDELPQLFNVLRGDMSLIGPRPEVPRYTALYDPKQMQVFVAKPGMSGPASLVYVNEEELLSRQKDPEAYYVSCLMPAKLKLDLAYSRNISFRHDFSLLCLTLSRLASLGPRRKNNHPIDDPLKKIAELS